MERTRAACAKQRTTYIYAADCCFFPPFDSLELIGDAQRSLEIPNAGGSSDISEALSMQYMHDRYGATDFIPEMEVPYWIESKICDYLMRLPNAETGDGEWIGVSVTRAMCYPFDREYMLERARDLLRRKLYGLIVARAAVMEECGFVKSFLHVWCANANAAEQIRIAHEEIRLEEGVEGAEKTYDDVRVVCTICPHKYIYTNKVTTPNHGL